MIGVACAIDDAPARKELAMSIRHSDVSFTIHSFVGPRPRSGGSLCKHLAEAGEPKSLQIAQRYIEGFLAWTFCQVSTGARGIVIRPRKRGTPILFDSCHGGSHA